METLLPRPVGAPEERSSRAGVTSRVPRETTGVTTKPRVVTRPAGGEGPADPRWANPRCRDAGAEFDDHFHRSGPAATGMADGPALRLR